MVDCNLNSKTENAILLFLGYIHNNSLQIYNQMPLDIVTLLIQMTWDLEKCD